jgi:hypothetical protein
MSLDSPSPALPLELTRILFELTPCRPRGLSPIGPDTSAGATSDACLVASAVCCISAPAREYRDSHAALG